ncbi:MAG: hypothetical protein NTW84_02940, partial [Methanothrix sp.]|nr:hypothetical protein [Methanothrix sp.]
MDKAIEHGKEWRKPHYHSERFDRTCRPHGGCPWCQGRREHKHKRRAQAVDIMEIGGGLQSLERLGPL